MFIIQEITLSGGEEVTSVIKFLLEKNTPTEQEWSSLRTHIINGNEEHQFYQRWTLTKVDG